MLFKGILGSQLSGALDGIVASRNRFGTYFRARANPVNPASPRQELVRQSLAFYATRWSEVLTEAQRLDWEVYAENTPVIGRTGDSIQLTGIDQYVRSCGIRRYASQQLALGWTDVDDAPVVFGLPEPAPQEFAIAGGNPTMSVSFDVLDSWVGEDDAALLVFVSTPHKASINFFAGPYLLVDAVLGDATTPPTSPAAVTVPQPAQTGQRIFVQTRVTRADARLSSPFRGRAVAT